MSHQVKSFPRPVTGDQIKIRVESESESDCFRLRVRLFQIRARARAPLFGAPARALVGTSFVRSASFSLPHHHLFESITVTQSRSEKLSSDYCLDPLSMPPAHFIGPESRVRLLSIVSVYRIQAIRGNKQQRAKTTETAKRCSKTIPM